MASYALIRAVFTSITVNVRNTLVTIQNDTENDAHSQCAASKSKWINLLSVSVIRKHRYGQLCAFGASFASITVNVNKTSITVQNHPRNDRNTSCAYHIICSLPDHNLITIWSQPDHSLIPAWSSLITAWSQPNHNLITKWSPQKSHITPYLPFLGTSITPYIKLKEKVAACIHLHSSTTSQLKLKVTAWMLLQEESDSICKAQTNHILNHNCKCL